MSVETTAEKTMATVADAPPEMQIQTDKVRTPGWSLFDKIVHTVGINWLGNIALSMWFAHDQTNAAINKKIDSGELKGEKRKVLFDFKIKNSASWKDKDGKELGQDLTFYSFVDWFRETKTDKFFGQFAKDKDIKNSKGLSEASAITVDVMFLSLGGHITTLLTQIFENKNIKPKMVRWLDDWLDNRRTRNGNAPTEEELKERQAIYHKLDNELSGKSVFEVWKARFVGIGVVIGALIGLRTVDKAAMNLVYGKPADEAAAKARDDIAGLRRLRQGFFAGSRATQRGLKSAGVEWSPNYLSDDNTSASVAYARQMAKLTATEVAGSTITAMAQYVTLMFKELFSNTKKADVVSNPEKDVETKKAATSGIPITNPAAKEKAEKMVTEITEKPAREMEESRLAHAENTREVKHSERTERKPIIEIPSRKDAPVESFAMQGV